MSEQLKALWDSMTQEQKKKFLEIGEKLYADHLERERDRKESKG